MPRTFHAAWQMWELMQSLPPCYHLVTNDMTIKARNPSGHWPVLLDGERHLQVTVELCNVFIVSLTKSKIHQEMVYWVILITSALVGKPVSMVSWTTPRAV